MLGTKIFTYLKKHQKTFLYVAFFAAIFFFFTDLAFANEGANANTQQKDSNPADWFNAFVQVIATGIGMLTNVVGLFLNPGWTNATGIGLHTHLKELWIMISNIVYVIFAFLLIVIAFMNIIGKGDKWELKQALPRFVIGVLIVPFSWLFVQVLIAFSSFLSVSVLMLPYEVLSNSPTSEWDTLKTKPVCTTYVVVSAKSEDSDNTKDPAPGFCGNAQPIGELMSSNGIYGLLNIYTFGIFSLDELSKINGKEVDTLTSIFKVGINGIVILLLAIVYFILIVSLCLALFVRGVWLWLYMIFSPVFGLLYFFDKGKDGFIEGKFSISEFISLAMVPVYVSAALAFGLLFIFVSGSAFTGQGETSGFLKFEMLGNGNDPKYTTGSSTNQSRVSSLTGSRITVLDEFKLDMYGDFGTSGKNAEGVFDVMKSGFGTLLMQLFGLAVLWIAVMAAINQSKITQAVVDPIAKFGAQVGGLIQKAPQYTPIPGTGGQSIASATRFGQLGIQHVENKPQEKAQQTFKNSGLFGVSDNSRLNAAYAEVKKNMGSPKDDAKAIKTMVHSVSDANVLVNNDKFITALAQAMEKAGVKGHDKLKIGDTTSFVKALNDYEAYLDGKPDFENIFTQDAKVDHLDTMKEISNAIQASKGSEGAKSSSNKSSIVSDSEFYEGTSNLQHIKVNDILLKFDTKGLLNNDEANLERFMRAVEGQSYDAIKIALENQGLNDFDKLFETAQSKLGGKSVIQKGDDGIIAVDSTKKNDSNE